MNLKGTKFQLKVWNYLKKIPKGKVKTYKDHRMAMAFAPIAIKYGSLEIEDPGVVVKSYPSFWKDLHEVGFLMED